MRDAPQMLTAQSSTPPIRMTSRCATAQWPTASTITVTRSRAAATGCASARGCGSTSSAAGMKKSEMAKIAEMPTTE